MIKLIRTLTPANGMKFHDICSFETENYVGMYNHETDRFVVMNQRDYELHLATLPECATLDELDNAVYEACGERIIGVSENSNYELIIKEA